VKHSRSTAALAAILALAACSGGTGGTATAAADPFNSYEAAKNEFTHLETAVDTQDYTEAAAVPHSGTARFTGFVEGGFPGVHPLDYDSDLAGKVALVADFAKASITGQATDFTRARITRSSQIADVEALKGSLTIDSGQIGATPPRASQNPNNVTLHLGGTLTGKADTIALDTTLFGQFRGSPIDGFVASTIAAGIAGYPQGSVTINGKAPDSFGFLLAAQKQ
jgi:hypothetical protein